jgi:hypothetical protein
VAKGGIAMPATLFGTFAGKYPSINHANQETKKLNEITDSCVAGRQRLEDV